MTKEEIQAIREALAKTPWNLTEHGKEIRTASTWLQQLLDENDRLKEENQKTRETLKGCEYCHKKALEENERLLKVEADFKALQNIMDRARALAMQSEEEWKPRYRMDANGNLTRVEQIEGEGKE